ncbi:MAG: ATP-binding protein [Clostridia bacterium]|nr:ATP-binding protein [Clostridia bacterium]
MRRNITNDLKKWKNSSFRKPLIVYGARQIGKTYSILEFGKQEYANVLYCNFEDNAELAAIFEQNLNPERIVKSLSAMFSVQVSPRNTLIFFDEIQACERALTSLKYFNETANDYHIIAAGSLLGLAVNRGRFSFPVGKVDMLNMYPMNFEEFLSAMGNDLLIDRIKECCKDYSPMELPLHTKAMELYRTYLVVGGYPDAVNRFVQTGDFNLVRAAQATISNAYIADMTKYATPSDTVKSIAVYNSIYSQLAKETTKFQYSVVDKKARSKSYEMALEWLKAANVVLPSVKITEGKMPINLYEEQSTFKIYYSDVGLFSMKSNMPAEKVIQNIDLSDKARGTLAECYVANELTSKGIPLHYWESQNSAEVDFILQNDDGVIPLEVKSSENVRSKSLKTYTDKYNPPYAIRISSRNFGFENGIKSTPLYAIFCL